MTFSTVIVDSVSIEREDRIVYTQGIRVRVPDMRILKMLLTRFSTVKVKLKKSCSNLTMSWEHIPGQ